MQRYPLIHKSYILKGDINTFALRTAIHIRLFFCLLFILNIYLLPQTDSLNIYDLDLAQLSQIRITTAAKVEQIAVEIPATVFVITKEELYERGILTLDEALASLPGFQFRNIQGINSYVFQRGIPNQNNLTLLLIDGIQINELNSGGFYSGSHFNFRNVKQIEVVYGPSSVAYGTNAACGVINIITEEPAGNSLYAGINTGTDGLKRGEFTCSYEGENNTWGLKLSGLAGYQDKSFIGGVNGDYAWSPSPENYEKVYTTDLKIHAGKLLAGVNFINRQTPTTTLYKTTGTRLSDRGTLWNIRFLNSYIKYSETFTKGLSAAFTLYNRNATVSGNSVYYVTDTAQTGYYRPNNLAGFEGICDYSVIDKLTVSGGLTFEYENLAQKYTTSYSASANQKPPKPPDPVMINNTLLSLFIEPVFYPLKDFRLSAGIRFDNSSAYHQVLTPRAGMVYKLRGFNFRLNYAEAFRAPKPWDYSDGIGNPDLKPERMKSFEAGVQTAFGRQADFDLSGYINRLDGVLIKENLTSGYRWINGDNVTTRGIEVFLKYKQGSAHTTFNYTFTESYDKSGNFIPELSRHTGYAGITYRISEFLRTNFQLIYASERLNPKVISSTGNDKIGAYLSADITITCGRFYGFNFQLSVKNLFDKKNYHPSNREPDRYIQPGRLILLGLDYNFQE